MSLTISAVSSSMNNKFPFCIFFLLFYVFPLLCRFSSLLAFPYFFLSLVLLFLSFFLSDLPQYLALSPSLSSSDRDLLRLKFRDAVNRSVILQSLVVIKRPLITYSFIRHFIGGSQIWFKLLNHIDKIITSQIFIGIFRNSVLEWLKER